MECMLRVLVTGSSGLIGENLTAALSARGVDVVRFDIRNSDREDVRDLEALRGISAGLDGIVHFAAVSRVVWAQNDPALCEAVNVGGIGNVAALVRASAGPAPWVLFSSSREVYGQQDVLPVHEDAELRPMNCYARSKVEGENIVAALRADGYRSSILRFSNVYGSPDDHADRVVPAFATAAALGGRIRLEGAGNVFDFTHVDDVVRALLSTIEILAAGRSLDPIHLVSGKGTSLAELSALAERHARAAIVAEHFTPRQYDVARFIGATERAATSLDWTCRIPIEDGFADLVDRIAHRHRQH